MTDLEMKNLKLIRGGRSSPGKCNTDQRLRLMRERIQKFLRENELSPKEFAKRAGVRLSALNKILWESPTYKNMLITTFHKIADSMGIPAAAFIADDEKRHHFIIAYDQNPLFAAKCKVMIEQGVNPLIIFSNQGERGVLHFPVMKSSQKHCARVVHIKSKEENYESERRRNSHGTEEV